MSSLKERLASYESNASTPKSTSAFFEDAKAEIAAMTKGAYADSDDEEHDEQEDLSLQDRMAAYKRGGTTNTKVSNGSKAETPPVVMSLKDRMAAYQQGVPLDDEEQPRLSVQPEEVPKKELTLKERMAAFQQQPKESYTKDLLPQKKKSPKSEEQPVHKINLQDRMAAFGDSRVKKSPKKRQSELKLRMANFQRASSQGSEGNVISTPTNNANASKGIDYTPQAGGKLSDRMEAYKGTVAPGSQMEDFRGGSLKKKGSYGSGRKPKPKAFGVSRKASGDLEKRMAAFKVASSPPPIFETKKVELTPEERGGDLTKRMAAFAAGATPKNATQNEEELEPPSNDESGVDEKNQSDENESNNNEEKHQLLVLGNIEKRMDSLRDLTAPEEERSQEEEEAEKPEVHKGSDLQKRLAAFAEVSSPDAYQKKKVEEGEVRSISPMPDIGTHLQERMNKFKEVSAPDAFFLKKKEEQGDLSPIKDAAIGDHLVERMEKFKEVSAADAFQKMKSEEHDNSGPVEEVAAGGHLQERLEKFKEVSSPEAFKKKKVEVGHVLSGSNLANDEGEHTPPPETFNPQDPEGEDDKPYMGKVVENKVIPMREGPKDYEYLYDLYINLENLKLQDHDSPHLTTLLEEEDKESDNKPNTDEKGDIKDALEGIIGGSTLYTANADWLNKEWIEEHLIRDENFDSLKFKFRDHMLFKRFDKTCQESRDVIIQKFVQELVEHANDITQLDLSSCLLPDKFLEVLAEEVLVDPDALPKLQLINLESNLLEGPGIEALSEAVKDVYAWRYLQVILLENQKHSMSTESERTLADAVSNSASIVVCSVSIRCPYQRKDINDAILYNTDQLRLARREHQAKEGTLKERKRNEIELYFDRIADDDESIIEVDLVGDQKFLTLDEEEKVHSGYSFATNTTVRTIKMEILGLDDHFAEAFGEAIAVNETIEKVNIDSNAITGEGMKAIFEGLGENTSIEEFQVRHQHKVMATLDEEALPDLLEPNTSLLKLGVDVRSKLVRMKLDRIINANRDRARKLRLEENN